MTHECEETERERDERILTVVADAQTDLTEFVIAQTLGHPVRPYEKAIYRRLEAMPVDELARAVVLLLCEMGGAHSNAENLVRELHASAAEGGQR